MDAVTKTDHAMLPAYSLSGDLRQNCVRWLVICLVMLVWGATDVRKRAVIDPARPDRHMTDFTCYTLAGEALLRGEDPYAISNIRGWPYVYLPMFAVLVAPLSFVDSQTQAFIWFVISAITVFGCYFEIRKLLDACRERIPSQIAAAIPSLLIVAALVALFPTLNCLQRGQVGVLKLYGVLLGTRLLVTSGGKTQSFVGGFVLAFPVVLKLTPALPVFCILLWYWGPMLISAITSVAASVLPTPRWLVSITQKIHNDRFSPSANVGEFQNSFAVHRRTPFAVVMGLACGGLFFLFLLPAAVSGWNQNLTHLQSFANKVLFPASDVYAVDFGGDVYSVRNQSLENAALRAGNFAAAVIGLAEDDTKLDRNEVRVANTVMGSPAAQHVVAAVRYGLLLAVLCAVLLLSFHRQPTSLVLAMSLGLVASLVVAPVARGHYFMLLSPAVVFAPIWFAATGNRSKSPSMSSYFGRWHTGVTVGLFLAAISIFHYAALPLSGRLGLLGLGTSAWLAVVTGIVVHREISRTLQSGQNMQTDLHDANAGLAPGDAPNTPDAPNARPKNQTPERRAA